MSSRASQLREQVLALSEEYFAEQFPAVPFVPGESAVPISGKVLGPFDLRYLVDAALDCWLTTGRFSGSYSATDCIGSSGAGKV